MWRNKSLEAIYPVQNTIDLVRLSLSNYGQNIGQDLELVVRIHFLQRFIIYIIKHNKQLKKGSCQTTLLYSMR